VSVQFVDNSDKYAKALFDGCNIGLTAAGLYAADAMRENIGSEGGRAVATSRAVRNTGGKVRRYKAIAEGQSIGKNEGRRYFEAAPPGNFPGNRTGALKRSMVSTRSTNLSTVVGSTLKYAGWLETGWERRKALTAKQKRYLHALRRSLERAGIVVTWGKHGSSGGKVWARPWLKRTIREESANISKVFLDTASEAVSQRVAQ